MILKDYLRYKRQFDNLNTTEKIKNKLFKDHKWLFNANFENLKLELKDGQLIIYTGVWYGGTWKNGIWLNGTWEQGLWESGFWHNGTWKDGKWLDGYWYDGKWLGGTWKNGTWKKGTWKNGEWIKGKIYNPITKKFEESDVNPAEFYKKIGYKNDL